LAREPSFGPEVEVAADAPIQGRFLASSVGGRDPVADPTRRQKHPFAVRGWLAQGTVRWAVNCRCGHCGCAGPNP